MCIWCVSVGACVYGVCTQMCTHEEARSVLLFHSLLYSLRQGLLLNPSLGLQPVDGSSAPFATPHSTAGFSHQCRGSHSGSQACLATALTTELSPRAPATVLPEVHFPISTWQGTQVSCLLLSGRKSRCKSERVERPASLYAAVSPMGPGFLGSISEGGSSNLLF